MASSEKTIWLREQAAAGQLPCEDTGDWPVLKKERAALSSEGYVSLTIAVP